MHGTNFSKTKYCPYCMSRLTDGEICPVCGLTRGNYLPQPHHLPPGTVLVDRYMVGRVLGEGGFGITYIGRDMRLDYRVAIKEYLPSDQVSRNTEIALDVTRYATVSEEAYEKGLQRFLNEARTLALMFKQPQIVTVHDFFEANGTAYIVMEYVDGTTFAELVKQYGGRIAPEELFPMIEPLFGALANVHKQGILHRDISPDNLMLENGNVRLLDFGSAREVQPTGQQTMTIALKKGYGPIEQYQGKGQGPWTDVYALSATIYYCLTGVKPPDAVERILDDELVPPRELGVDMPQWQEQALLYGMSVNPTKRYHTMDAMHAGLYLPPADTIVPSPAVLGGVAVLEAGFAPEEAQAQALSQVEEKSAEAVPQTEVNQVQENQDEALPQAEVLPQAETLSQVEEQPEQIEADQAQLQERQQEEKLEKSNGENTEEKTVLSSLDEVAEQPVADDIEAEDNLASMDSQKEDAAEDSVTENHRDGFLSYISTHRPPAITAGVVLVAVVALAIVLAVLIPRLGPNDNDPNPTSYTSGQDGNKKDDASDADGQDENGQDDVVEQEPETEEFVDYDALFASANCQHYSESSYNEGKFRKSLTSAGVSAITLSGNFEITEEDLVIDKPVLVETGGCADIYSHVTVTGDGVLMVKGDAAVNGMIEVQDGGQIIVANGGSLEVRSLLWLQDEDSCVLQDGSTLVLEGETYTSIADAAMERTLLVLDEESQFAHVMHIVNSDTAKEVLDGTIKGTSSRAFIIDADMTFTEDVNQTVPVMISEGVTVTMADGATWCNRESVFLNYGTFNGSFQGGEWDDGDGNAYEPENSLWSLLNYGQFHSDSLDFPSKGTVVNDGQLVMDADAGSAVDNVVFCNLGEFDHAEHSPGNSRLCNYGTYNTMPGAYGWQSSDSVLNMGEVRIAEDVEFTNEATVENRGTITVEDGATMNNNAVITSNSADSAITVSSEGNWGGYGMVIYSGASTLDLQGAAEELDASQSFRFSWYHDKLEDAYSADDLAELLGSDSSPIVIVGRDITYEGDLDFTDHVLVIKEGATLTVDGDVTVNGSDAAIYLQWGSLLMGDHILTLSDEAVLQMDDTLQCGTLDVQSGSRVMAPYQWSAGGLHFIVEGGVVNTLDGVNLQDCVVEIGSGASLNCYGDMNLSATTMNVGGTVRNQGDGETYLDADTIVTITEDGHIAIIGTVTLDGMIENYGSLEFNYGELYVEPTGILNNYHSLAGGTWQIHLAGTMYNGDWVTFDTAEIIEEGGSYSGNDPEWEEDEWIDGKIMW